MTRPISIVIVDDKESITDLFESYFNILDISCELHTFNDPVLALEFLKSNSVHVVITDYNMPNVNGLELLSNAPADAVKIMISGYVPEFAEEQLSSLDARFFEKPVPMKEIGRIVMERLSRTI